MSCISKSSASVVISLCVFLAALCTKDANAATNPNMTTVAPTLNQTMTGNNTVTLTTPEVCEDENKSCKWWKKFGYCYYGYVKGYMRKVCKKTCGFCGRISGKCGDKFFYCPSWIRYTGGKALACKLSFYQKRCPKTCNACNL